MRKIIFLAHHPTSLYSPSQQFPPLVCSIASIVMDEGACNLQGCSAQALVANFQEETLPPEKDNVISPL